MSDLKLKHVSIRNWMKLRQVDLDFPDKGLILVQGINSASGGALLSVGAGKSSVGEAVSRTLLGITGRFTHLKQFSADKKGNTYVKLEASLHDKELIVESGYKCKELSTSGEALRYHYDGKAIERGKIEQTRAELNKLLGISSLLASWTVFVDGDCIKFNKLSQADSVELVMSSLQQPPWNEYHENSKAFVGKFRRSMAVAESDHKRAFEELSTATTNLSLAKLEAKSQSDLYSNAVTNNQKLIDTLQSRITNRNKDIANASLELKEIAKNLKLMTEERAVASHDMEIKLHDLEDKIASADDARKPYSDARNKAQQKLTEARLGHSNYLNSSKQCPTCGQATGKIDQNRLDLLAENFQTAKAAYDKTDDAWRAKEQAIVTLNAAYRELSKQHREISAKDDVGALMDRHEELEIAKGQGEDEIHQYELQLVQLRNGPSDTNLKLAQDRLKTKTRDHEKAKEAANEAGKILNSDQSTLKVLDYWNMAFSPYGIPNMVLRKAIAPLNKEARRVSAAMTGGTIEVRYSTVKEMASGLEKAQLNIEVDNKLGDKDLNGSSKGEAGLTNFIISETLSEVGQVSRRIGYMWADELLPNQDPKVCQSIYAYLKDKADRLGILIFLVDHNPVAANYADKILLVEKTGSAENCSSLVSWR